MPLVHEAIIRRIFRLGLVLAAVATASSGCTHLAKSDAPFDVKLAEATLRYVRNRPSVPGRFLITIANPNQIPVLGKSLSYAYALETDGRLVPLETLESRIRELKILDLKPIGEGLYGYTTCVLGEARCSPASIRFMDRAGHTVDLTTVPNEHDDLNFHDFRRLPNGRFLYLFATFDLRAKTNANRIQEWDEKGRVIFDWSGDAHLKEFGLAGLPHINSLDVDRAGNILISVPQLNTLYKIERPSGRTLASISAKEWTFPNDPLGGFKFQHSARYLPNGNVLVFDNGDGVNGRASRAVEYVLDFEKKTATLVWERRLTDDTSPFRKFGGMAQRLSNGNTVVTWGTPESQKPDSVDRVVTEIDPQGNVVRELRGHLLTYRIWFDETTP